jgi:hypothetical protein
MKVRIVKKGLPKAQTGLLKLPDNFAQSISQNVSNSQVAFANPQLIKDYFGTMGKTDLMLNVQGVKDEELRKQFPGLGPTPQQKALENAFNTQPAAFGKSPVGYICLGLDANGKPNIQSSSYRNDEARKAAGASSTKAEAAAKCGGVGYMANQVSDIADATLAVGSVVDYFGQNKKLKDFERSFRQNQFDNQAVSPSFRGNYNVNTGRFRDDVTRKPNEGMFQMGGEENFSNISDMIKIRITGKPENLEFEYGGQNGYGLDLGQRRVQTEMPESKADSVSSSISSVPRYAANIEAEGGETVYGDLDGDGGLEHMKINGPRHSEGGVPLNVPEGSFIFSDTAKMKIKDPNVLKYFGLPAKKGGYTPAEIAKRYDINKYKAVVEDETSDELNKNTAQLMISNYNKKLSALAMVQEEMKGFPQGIPAVAEQDKMPMAKYGGYLPEYQSKGEVKNRVAVWDEEEQKMLQDFIKQKYNVEIPINARDTDPNSQRFTLPTVQNSRSGRRVYGDEDWTSASNMADFAKRQKKFLAENPNWDPTKVGATEKFQKWYNAERAKKGMKPYFGKGLGFQEVDDEFGEYTFSTPELEPTEPVKETPKTYSGFKCLGLKEDGSPNIQSSSYPTEEAFKSSGTYATSQEAAMHCPGETIPGKIPPGETPVQQKPGFLTPDKLALLTAGLVPPQAYLPSVADLPFRQGDLALEDWLSKAQQRQQTFNTSATTLGQYQPGTAMASNLSFLAGQTGEGVAQDIAQTDSRNVDRANQFMNMELQRKTANDAYNANARDKRWEGFVTAKQNLDNSRRQYLTGITKAANNAWANRMYLDMINKVNPIYNVDPRSGLSYFKRGYDPSKLGTMSSAGSGNMDWAGLSKGYNAAKSSFPDLTVDQYMRMASPRTTLSDTDADGFANSIRTSMNQGSNMLSLFAPLMNQMRQQKKGGSVLNAMQIGPWR